jgi:hypothetical protein
MHEEKAGCNLHQCRKEGSADDACQVLVAGVSVIILPSPEKVNESVRTN